MQILTSINDLYIQKFDQLVTSVVTIFVFCEFILYHRSQIWTNFFLF